MTLADVFAFAKHLAPNECIEIDGDAMRANMFIEWPDGSRSLTMTVELI